MPRPSIAVLTFTDDLHALVIQAHLRRNHGALCEVVEVDTMADRPGGLSWSTEPGFGTSVPTRDGGRLDLAGCDVIWFRRWNHPQRAGRELSEPAHREVVDASCASTLMGALRNEFDGRWVSHPDATRRAENKLIQLRAAVDAGFVVPRTLVSQDPVEIRRFCSVLGGRVVLKAVRGTPSSQLYTLPVTPEHLADDDALRLCPTIFQEYVPGTRHLRVLCCGTTSYAVAIDSPDLDWRRNLDVPIEPVALDPLVQRALARVLELLDLRMGVVDLKLDPDGRPVWLELNPQGQFLFVQGLTGLDLTAGFAGFLCDEALTLVRAPGRRRG